MHGGKYRIAVCGIHIESSTFSPHRAGSGDFTVTHGDALLERYDALPVEAEWIPLVHARALPGGMVEREFFDAILADLLARLRQAHSARGLDGVYLDIHGAMSVEGVSDAEGLLAAAVRGIVGGGVLLSASMDPHGNVSRELVDNVDLLTSHRMSPHEDAHLTLARAQRKLVDCLLSGVRPLRAWVSVPVLLPGEKACTRDEPAKRLYGLLPAIEDSPGVIDAAIWIGYAWADEARCQAAVVVAGTDVGVIVDHARELARQWWRARGDFGFSTGATDADAAIRLALDAWQRPFFVSDSGDNPTAGGSGDVPYMVGRLLANRRLASGERTAILASVVDPGVVERCGRAPVGSAVRCRVGGSLGWPGSVELSGEVVVPRVDDPVGGHIAVVRCGGVSVVLTSRRKPFHRLKDFTELGLDPYEVDVTVVKVGYLVPELFNVAAGWVLALTPGGVDQDIARLGHQRVSRPMFPLDVDMATPALRATVVGPPI